MFLSYINNLILVKIRMEGKPLQIFAVSIGFLVPSYVIVVLRCYVRIWVKRFVGADDYLAVASLV